MLTINNDVHRDSVHEVVGCLAYYSLTIMYILYKYNADY